MTAPTEWETVPTVVNGRPVVAAMKVSASDRDSEHVVIVRDTLTTLVGERYIVWRVAFRFTGLAMVSGKWIAENGNYALTWKRAGQVFASRLGLITLDKE